MLGKLWPFGDRHRLETMVETIVLSAFTGKINSETWLFPGLSALTRESTQKPVFFPVSCFFFFFFPGNQLRSPFFVWVRWREMDLEISPPRGESHRERASSQEVVPSLKAFAALREDPISASEWGLGGWAWGPKPKQAMVKVLVGFVRKRKNGVIRLKKETPICSKTFSR